MAKKETKLELTWIGKDKRPRLEPRILLEDSELSYSAKKKVTDNDIFDNMLIHGDNLLALKALEQDFTNRFKCVYIDPPFNTQQAFEHYEDGVEHSLWLSLMRERIAIIHRLMHPEGTLFVHIDDNELGYLIVLLDELFGRANRVSIVTFKQGSATGHKAINPGCVTTTNFVLMYAKDKATWKPNRVYTARERDKRYNQFITNIDAPHHDWEIVTLMAAFAGNQGVSEKEARSLARKDPGALDEFVKEKGKSVVRLARPSYNAVSKAARELIDQSKANPKQVLHLPREGHKDFYFIRGERILFYKHKIKEIDGQFVAGEPLTTLWEDLLSNNLHNEGGVSFPKGKKPEALIKRVIELSTRPGDWVFDSFAGSGTTGSVAHKAGRRWVMVELGDHCHTHILPRLRSIVDGTDTSGSTQATNWKGGGGFRFYNLAPSLLEEDKWGNWVINRSYNKEMLAEAVCKLEGFKYRPSDLIAHAKAKDAQLGADLDQEFKQLSSRLPFGLNFERHRPEAVELPQRPVRKGDKVRALPGRGSAQKGDQRLWQVKKISKNGDGKIAELELLGAAEAQTQTSTLDDLVVVAEFRDTLYPGLVSTGKVQRGADKPHHTVINGENYHVLKALTYTHRGKVDLIYIDPPYNSGARDWKYNNDYVAKDDLYRHSKWLAFMERRLEVAKDLLNASSSVLICAIDENEVHRLGLLIEQVFQGVRMQTITTVINPKGASLGGDFARVEEHLFVLYFGGRVVPEVRDMLDESKNSAASRTVKWSSLIRGGAQGIRTDSPGAFYPVFIDCEDSRIHSFGDALPSDQTRDAVLAPEGMVAVWPPNHPSGVEGRWGIGPETARELLRKGALRLGRIDLEANKFPLSYLSSGIMEKVESGEIETTGRKPDGTLVVRYPENTKVTQPKTVWKMPSHNAGEYGSKLLSALLPQRKFPFPKSLYAVEDILGFFLRSKPDATVLDFFAGSGTTVHAVMRLNHQDGGARQCISVTNNEVAAGEQDALRKQGLRPGDPEWERLGICDYITKPRVEAAITGNTPTAGAIQGSYKFTDEFPMADGFEENAEFFTLTYETPISINHNRAFARIAPLLWLRAGSRGPRIDKISEAGWGVVDAYGLLVDLDGATPFCKAVNKAKDLCIAYIVTDDDRRFQAIARRLPDDVEPVRLYESYLTNFSFANGE